MDTRLFFELREEDAVASFWAQVRRDPYMRRKIAMRRWVFPLGFGTGLLIAGALTNESSVVLASLVALVVGMPLAIWVYNRRLRRRVVAEVRHGPNRDCLCRHEVWFDESGVGNRVEFFEEKVEWPLIKDIAWDDQRGFIFFATRRVFIVPRDAETESDFESFFAALAKAWARHP